jgi:hypothetical protein
MKDTTTGIADVYLDGTKMATIDLYASPAVYNVTVWSTDTLVEGTPYVEIVRNAGSPSGKYVTLDAMDGAGSLISAPSTNGSVLFSDGFESSMGQWRVLGDPGWGVTSR